MLAYIKQQIYLITNSKSIPSLIKPYNGRTKHSLQLKNSENIFKRSFETEKFNFMKILMTN